MAFDPERKKEKKTGTHEEKMLGAPEVKGSFGARFLSAKRSQRNVCREANSLRVCDRLERLTREEGAWGMARRCKVPGCVGRRLAQEDGRWGRTVEQLGRNRKEKNTFIYILQDVCILFFCVCFLFLFFANLSSIA